MKELITRSLHAPRKRRPTRATKGSVEARLRAKKRDAAVKKLRGSFSDERLQQRRGAPNSLRREARGFRGVRRSTPLLDDAAAMLDARAAMSPFSPSTPSSNSSVVNGFLLSSITELRMSAYMLSIRGLRNPGFMATAERALHLGLVERHLRRVGEQPPHEDVGVHPGEHREIRAHERRVLVPGDEHEAALPRVLVQVEVVHPFEAEDAVVLRDRVLHRDVGQEPRVTSMKARTAATKPGVRRLVHGPDERDESRRVELVLVGLRLEGAGRTRSEFAPRYEKS